MERKYLDEVGLQYLWSKISLQDYPNNDTLITVLNAIDETKANKTDLNNYLLKEDYQGGSGDSTDLSNYLTKTEIENNYVSKTDTISVDKGGTGATTASAARTNLGLVEESLTFTLIDGTTITKTFLVVN
jgi:hypothetical protein